MVITPNIRGFICTNAHPVGCAENVKKAVAYAKKHVNPNIPQRILIVGSSTGYGLACRIAAAFGNYSKTVGVFLEREASEKRTATAGYYNNLAFESLAKENHIDFRSINGDAFSNEIKGKTIQAIKDIMPEGKIDLVIYSLAASKRTDPNKVTHFSVIKPIGNMYINKTVDFNTREVYKVSIEPATKEEIEGTIAVMGGEDWLLWIKTLQKADILAECASTVAFSYIGSKITHPIYKDGTIGRAKIDLEEKANEISQSLLNINGKAFVSVNKALVTQASSAIPVVPLYISILYKIMKEKGVHEGCIEQAVRLYEKIYGSSKNLAKIETDKSGRIRLDDWEMNPDVQSDVENIWNEITSLNLEQLTDIEGYRKDFYSLFGFEIDSVNYAKSIEFNI